MATEKLAKADLWEVPAGSDLSTKQYYIMKFSTGKLALAGDGELPCGILQDKPNADGVSGTIAVRGVSKCVAGAAVTQGVLVASDANGKVVASIATDNVLGIALTGAAADLDVISVLISIGAPQT